MRSAVQLCINSANLIYLIYQFCCFYITHNFHCFKRVSPCLPSTRVRPTCLYRTCSSTLTTCASPSSRSSRWRASRLAPNWRGTTTTRSAACRTRCWSVTVARQTVADDFCNAPQRYPGQRTQLTSWAFHQTRNSVKTHLITFSHKVYFKSFLNLKYFYS